jgi:hypothetical protein
LPSLDYPYRAAKTSPPQRRVCISPWGRNIAAKSGIRISRKFVSEAFQTDIWGISFMSILRLKDNSYQTEQTVGIPVPILA